MDDNFDLVISGGRVVTPGGIVETDIGVRHQRIAALGDLGHAKTAARLDARSLHVLPGVIDTQVHFREPGYEYKEDLATGTTAAVLGGVSAIFDMPNTKPSTLTAGDLADKIQRATGRARCDYAFFVGGTAENARRLAALETLPGCAGIKIFMGSSTGHLLLDDPELLAQALQSGFRRVAIHAEDEGRLKERRKIAEEGGHARFHPEWRDVQSALRATENLLAIAGAARRRVHVLHVTTAEEMALLSRFRDIATVEVTPQHLTLAAPECYERLGTYAQMNPPIRDAHHREALWWAVRSGIVDCIGSDHAPHTREEKNKPYPSSPSGMPGVQTMVPIMLDHLNRGRLSLERLVDLLCAGPARIYGIARKGRIGIGYDADFTLVDLAAKREIANRWIASRVGWTPFDGMKVTGWPVGTIVRGHVAMRDDQVLGEPAGQPVRFGECLWPSP